MEADKCIEFRENFSLIIRYKLQVFFFLNRDTRLHDIWGHNAIF